MAGKGDRLPQIHFGQSRLQRLQSIIHFKIQHRHAQQLFPAVTEAEAGLPVHIQNATLEIMDKQAVLGMFHIDLEPGLALLQRLPRMDFFRLGPL